MHARHPGSGSVLGTSHESSVPVAYTSIVRTAMSGRPNSAWIISPCSVTLSVPSTDPDGCAWIAM